MCGFLFNVYTKQAYLLSPFSMNFFKYPPKRGTFYIFTWHKVCELHHGLGGVVYLCLIHISWRESVLICSSLPWLMGACLLPVFVGYSKTVFSSVANTLVEIPAP